MSPQSLPLTGALLISLALVLSVMLAVLAWWSRLGAADAPPDAEPSGRVSRSLRWLDRLGAWVLTQDPRLRPYLLHFLTGTVASLAGLAALQFGVQLGIVDAFDANVLTLTAVLTCIGLYARLRALSPTQNIDGSIMSLHLHAFMGFLAWGYTIGGEGRPVALMLLVLMLSFNVFLADATLMRRLSVSSAVLFGGAMMHVAWMDSSNRLTPSLQLVYFSVLLVMLLCLTVMIRQFDGMRRKSRERKQALEQALARIGELATRDDLTGLFNRRHMLEWLHTERQRAMRQGRPFCIGLVDLDHFKNVNDRHGHTVGDEALTHAARTLAAGLRESDLIARWGGEEFLVVFTDTDCATAQMALDRIRQNMLRTMASASVPDLVVNFSAGLTAYHPDELLTRAMDRADRALYMAKAGGRGCTKVMEDNRVPSKASQGVPGPHQNGSSAMAPSH